jgi:hypothetical protein
MMRMLLLVVLVLAASCTGAHIEVRHQDPARGVLVVEVNGVVRGSVAPAGTFSTGTERGVCTVALVAADGARDEVSVWVDGRLEVDVVAAASTSKKDEQR